ncbi:alpha/beta hydrolase [Kribbella sp.]|uniref:alpha/beta hydrolase n=1 Tax=Kribbella sp. TaxID=1871183 RepID=UPI002D57142E|nr:alpha/beta hydrolase [Kribbella sp.]HZX01452.1 alpha/beta hydrolase [Kribbella sp.]
MRLTMRLIMALAALQGRPIRLSGVAAGDDDPDSVVITPDPRPRIRGGRRAGRGHKGIEYSPGLKIDVLAPAGPGPHPLVVYLPGGGFVSARRMMAGKQRRYVADAGFVVASIDYRTTTVGATYHDGLADVATALGFLRSHAAEYDLDPDRVALWGESAGAYLAAMAATDPDNRVDAVVDLFGASKLDEVAAGFDAAMVAAITGPKSAIPAYVLGPGRAFADHPDEVRQADPVSRVTPGTPPFLLLHGDDDRIIAPSQTARLHQALRAAGVSTTRYVVKGAGHGELSDNPAPWTGTQLMNLITDFLHTTLIQH